MKPLVMFVALCLHFVGAHIATADARKDRQAFLDQFSKTELGIKLSDLKLPQNWIESAQIQHITAQFGLWHVKLQKGTEVFRIFPYYIENEHRTNPEFEGYSCVVIKVDNGDLRSDGLVNAFRQDKEHDDLRLIEVAVHYPDGHTEHRPRKAMGPTKTR